MPTCMMPLAKITKCRSVLVRRESKGGDLLLAGWYHGLRRKGLILSGLVSWCSILRVRAAILMWWAMGVALPILVGVHAFCVCGRWRSMDSGRMCVANALTLVGYLATVCGAASFLRLGSFHNRPLAI